MDRVHFVADSSTAPARVPGDEKELFHSSSNVQLAYRLHQGQECLRLLLEPRREKDLFSSSKSKMQKPAVRVTKLLHLEDSVMPTVNYIASYNNTTPQLTKQHSPANTAPVAALSADQGKAVK